MHAFYTGRLGNKLRNRITIDVVWHGGLNLLTVVTKSEAGILSPNGGRYSVFLAGVR